MDDTLDLVTRRPFCWKMTWFFMPSQYVHIVLVQKTGKSEMAYVKWIQVNLSKQLREYFDFLHVFESDAWL